MRLKEMEISFVIIGNSLVIIVINNIQILFAQ